MDSLIDVLVECLNADRDGAFGQIAKYLLIHINDLETVTVKDITENCYVSTALVNKFCAHFNYKNFTVFKKSLLGFRTVKFKQISERIKNTDLNLLYQVYQASTKNECPTKEKLFSKIDQAVDLLYNSDKITIYSAIYPLKLLMNFQINMFMLGKTVMDYRCQELNSNLASSNQHTVFIISGTGQFISLDVSDYNEWCSKSNFRLFFTPKSPFVDNIKESTDLFFPFPDNKDNIQMNYTLLALFDLIFYFYFKKFALTPSEV